MTAGDGGAAGGADGHAADEGARAAAGELLARAKAVAVLTGAGISTDAGIPDFRGPSGLWTRDPEAEKLSTLRYYLRDADVRRRSWQGRLTSPLWSALPTPGHLALVALEQTGRLDRIITQNVDGLHQRAGSDPARVIEIHGSALTTICWTCGARLATSEVLERVRAGDLDPSCRASPQGGRLCGGILKTATVSFGQAIDPSDLMQAEQAVARADVLLAVGSTLTVHPVAGLVPLAARRGTQIVIVNAEPTPYDDLAAALVRAPISQALPEIVRGR
jgi:NAD-dependent deacetylase